MMLNANPRNFLPLDSPAEGVPSSGAGQGAGLSGLAGQPEQVGWLQGLVVGMRRATPWKASRKWGDTHE